MKQLTLQHRQFSMPWVDSSRISQFTSGMLVQPMPQAPVGQFEMRISGRARPYPAALCVGLVKIVAKHLDLIGRNLQLAMRHFDLIMVFLTNYVAQQHIPISQNQHASNGTPEANWSCRDSLPRQA